MRYLRVLACCVVLTAAGQGTSSPKALDAELIVVGDVVSASAADEVTAVQIALRLRVLRVIRGTPPADGELNLAWHYEPRWHEVPATTTKVPAAHGLWFLRQTESGVWEPMHVITARAATLGGVVLELPPGPMLAEFSYGDEAEPETKLAMELGSALSQIAAAQGDKLNPDVHIDASGAYGVAFTQEMLMFLSLRSWLMELPPEAAQAVFVRLAASPLPNARMMGLCGLLRAGDWQVLSTMERELPQLAPTLAAGELAMTLSRLSGPQTPASVVALGRLAMAEEELPGLDFAAALKIGDSKQVDGLPFLAAMIEGPHSQTREAALLGFCSALRPPSPLASMWNAEKMDANCPQRTPLPDPRQEQAMMDFWRAWFAQKRDQLAQGGTLPDVRPPSRYRSGPEKTEAQPTMPLETRWQILASMLTFQPHKEGQTRTTGDIALFSDFVLPAADLDRFKQIVLDTNRKVTEHRAAMTMLIQEQRALGHPVDKTVMDRAIAEEKQILSDELNALRHVLSSEAWARVEKRLQEF